MNNCPTCIEERRKANNSRKFAHELKNIFITISTVVNSEIEAPTLTFSSFSANTNHVADSGDVSPFIMQGRKQRMNSKTINNNNNNNKDSPFYFLKTLCDYGSTLIKEINELGKDFTDNGNNKISPFNISKAIDFCVEMFDTKKKYDYDKTKRNIQIYSDINFSYDKEIQSISETGFKMVLINLLTNSYKFTKKGKIIVRAVSMPKEKKIRILVKDTGQGFNPNDFIQNGCFVIYKRNQDLNVNGSGLGLTIVSDILTKFNIKLDCISSTEKGGTLFFFDLDDSYPYYDVINPQNLLSNSLSQIIKDINSGKKDNEDNKDNEQKNHFNNFTNVLNMNNAKKLDMNNLLHSMNDEDDNQTNNFKENLINMNNNNINNKKIESENNSGIKIIHRNAKFQNNKNSSINNEKQRFSFKDINDINISPTFNNNSSIYKTSDKKLPIKNQKTPIEKNTKNLNVNIINVKNAVVNVGKVTKKIGNISNNENNISNIDNTIILTSSPHKKNLDRLRSFGNRPSMQKESSNIKKDGKNNILNKVIKNGKSLQKMKTFNLSANKPKEIHCYKGKVKKSTGDIYTFIEKEEENIDEDLKNMDAEIKKMKEEKKKQQKNYKQLLNKNYNKNQFYLFSLKKIFKKNEIYIHLALNNKKKCITEPPSERNSPKNNLKTKKSFYGNNNKVYIIICDDEEFVAMSAKELIMNYYTKKGKEPHVYFTPNGIECLYLMYKLTIIENRKIEYILMDLEMPYLNGVKTCNIIKSIKETNVPIYILSGDEPNDCSADGYCNKPLNEIDVINKLDKDNNCK